jgi:hypothetical protein
MFYCYVLRSQKTGRRYVGSCENLVERIRRHNAGESKATKHGLRGFCSTAKRSPPVPQQHSVSGITRRAEVGMNWKATVKRSPRRQAVGSNPTSPMKIPCRIPECAAVLVSNTESK